MSLNAGFNDEIEIIAKGEDAEEAVAKLAEGFNEGLGEEVKRKEFLKKDTIEANLLQDNTGQQNNINIDNINNSNYETILKGITIFPNVVIGRTFLLKNEEIIINEYANGSPLEEANRLYEALNKVKESLNINIQKANDNNQNSQAEIFSAHLDVLSDQFLINEANSSIEKGKSAEFAWRYSSNKTCDVLNNTNNKLLQERVSDVKDIERSVLNALLGRVTEKISFPENSIIIAEDLVPSDLIRFDNNVKGVILSLGSSTSHISIMMKNNGIPAMVAVGMSILKVKDFTNVILNSREAIIILNPSEQKLNTTKQEIEKLKIKTKNNLENSKKPAITLDGLAIKVKGNIGSIEQAKQAYEKGGEGIGLVRSEFLFFGTKKAPQEDEQYKIYQAICDAMKGSSVIVRTLDVGGDKPISYINMPHEENPIVGLRGVRNYYYNKEIFLSQIRALLRVKPTGICRIMIPMVSLISEVIEIKKIIEEEKNKLGITDHIQIGTMVEVPSAAVMAEQFSKYLDFLSIGTNDLAQYTLAMDRGHPILTKEIENLNPAVLKMIKFTCDGASKYKIPVGVCGAMASEAESVPLLIGLGVVDLSVSRDLIPEIKALIRLLDYKKCKQIAEQSLTMECAKSVKDLVKKEFGHLI